MQGDNSKRNMNEIVQFRNATDFDLDMVYGNDNFGVAKAGEITFAPRFVAEHWAARNLKYQVLDSSPEVIEIENKKKEYGAVESIYDIQKNESLSNAKLVQQMNADRIAAEAALAAYRMAPVAPATTPVVSPVAETPAPVEVAEASPVVEPVVETPAPVVDPLNGDVTPKEVEKAPTMIAHDEIPVTPVEAVPDIKDALHDDLRALAGESSTEDTTENTEE